VSGGRSGQIGCVNERNRNRARSAFGQQRFQQVLVDLAKAAHTHTSPELVEHPYIRDGLAIGQMGKAAPILLLGQHLDQQVEGMDGTQQS
jgi:hypothetical protein